MDQNTPPRRWLSFGIRDLFWAIALVGTLLAWTLHHRELKQELNLLRQGNEFLVQDAIRRPGHPWNLNTASPALPSEVKSSAVVDDESAVAATSLVGGWSIERLDIASERGVTHIAGSGNVKITETVLEVSCLWGGRQTQRPFEYSVDEQMRTIELIAGEWDGGFAGAGPNRYGGQYELEGETLRISFGRMHTPDSFTPKPLEPAVDELFATPGSDRAWFLTLKRNP